MEHSFEHTYIPLTTVASGKGTEPAEGLYCLPIQIVNLCMLGSPAGGEDWVLVDAGMPQAASFIREAAEERFGRKPKAIVLTHGHFDHVGALIELVEAWQVPVYAHELELPYLQGQLDYPPGDPTVDGGLVSELSPLFPHRGIDLGGYAHPLPKDGHVPGLPDWRWIHTPGHTPGHISLFREKDRALVAGDAFVTVKQESLYKVIVQELELSGPPKYFTTDWKAARESVQTLADLKPAIAATGHGKPLAGEALTAGLAALAADFERRAVPEHGRYVH